MSIGGTWPPLRCGSRRDVGAQRRAEGQSTPRELKSAGAEVIECPAYEAMGSYLSCFSGGQASWQLDGRGCGDGGWWTTSAMTFGLWRRRRTSSSRDGEGSAITSNTSAVTSVVGRSDQLCRGRRCIGRTYRRCDGTAPLGARDRCCASADYQCVGVRDSWSGKLITAGSGQREADLAREVGVPPWKLKSMRSQARGWDQGSLASALRR